MASNFARVVTNAFEQVLSSDVDRAQTLLSREIQNLARDLGRRDTVTNFEGGVINGFTRDPTLDWSGLGHTTRVGPGSGFFSSFVGVSADESDYQVMQWPQTDLTHATPDASFPRIDIISAAIGIQNTDLTVRNILVDPVNRTVAAQTVPKTRNPLSPLTVTTGTPSAVPIPPTTPTDQVVIAEILVPASAASGATYSRAKMLFRRTVAPIAGMHAVVQGCQLTWTAAFPSTLGMAGSVSRVVIAGETIRFTGSAVSVVGDAGANNPFLVAAPAANDKPYYIYLAKGGFAQAGTNLQSVVIIESLVVPTVDGFPSASLITPRGSTGSGGAVFIGCGYVFRGTTSRRECTMDGDWITADCETTANSFESYITTYPNQIILGSVPAMNALRNTGVTQRAWGRFALSYDSAGGIPGASVPLRWSSTPTAGLERTVLQVAVFSASGVAGVGPLELQFRTPDGANPWHAVMSSSSAPTTWTTTCRPIAYQLRIPRIGGV